MDFNQYHKESQKFAMFASAIYPVLALAGEAGEFADKVAKVLRIRDTTNPLARCDVATREALLDELGDVLWMVAACADLLHSDLDYIALRNLEKLTDRADRGVICGSGDNR